MDTITNWPPWMMTCLLKKWWLGWGLDRHKSPVYQAGEGCSFYHTNFAFSFLTSVEQELENGFKALQTFKGCLPSIKVQRRTSSSCFFRRQWGYMALLVPLVLLGEIMNWGKSHCVSTSTRHITSPSQREATHRSLIVSTNNFFCKESPCKFKSVGTM